MRHDGFCEAGVTNDGIGKMKQIWKYPIGLGETEWAIPRGAQVLTAQLQMPPGVLSVWALVDTQAEKETRLFKVYGTGHDVTDKNLSYISTIQIGALVWHVFESIKP